MPLTTARKQAVLDYLYGKTALTPPDTLRIGLSSTTPTAAGANFTEPTVDGLGVTFKDGYSRVQVDNNKTTFENATAAEPSVLATKIAIEFAACSGNAWPQVTHWGIFVDNDPATAPIDWAALTTPKTVGVGDIAKFLAGELKTRLQNPA